MTRRLGVCSWSLEPRSADDLVEKVRACGVRSVQLALDPLRTRAWDAPATARALRAADIEIASGMMAMQGEDYSTLESIRRTGGVAPAATWHANLAAAGANAALAQSLGISLVSFHAGFIPHDRADPLRAALLDRLRALVDAFVARGVGVAFETGQETAVTLLDALVDLERSDAGVNFDPANMILYGLASPDEVRVAMSVLAKRVRQIHVKDALPTKTPGAWGEEVPAGTGAVDWARQATLARELRLQCDWMIEREAGTSRVADIVRAREHIEELWEKESRSASA